MAFFDLLVLMGYFVWEMGRDGGRGEWGRRWDGGGKGREVGGREVGKVGVVGDGRDERGG